jgi:hypothetical protein
MTIGPNEGHHDTQLPLMPAGSGVPEVRLTAAIRPPINALTCRWADVIAARSLLCFERTVRGSGSCSDH